MAGNAGSEDRRPDTENEKQSKGERKTAAAGEFAADGSLHAIAAISVLRSTSSFTSQIGSLSQIKAHRGDQQSHNEDSMTQKEKKNEKRNCGRKFVIVSGLRVECWAGMRQSGSQAGGKSGSRRRRCSKQNQRLVHPQRPAGSSIHCLPLLLHHQHQYHSHLLLPSSSYSRHQHHRLPNGSRGM